MIYRLLTFLIGLFIATISLSITIISFSLLQFGYTLEEFVNYLIKRPETYLFPVGLIMMILAVVWVKKH